MKHRYDATSIRRGRLLAGAILFALSGTTFAMDTPPPQVAVEPRLVDVSDVFQWNLGIDYAHINPSLGANGDQWGGSVSGYYKFRDGPGLNLDLGYHRVSSSGAGLDNWNFGAALAWNNDAWRYGGFAGYQRSSVSSFSVNATDYGLFADFFATPEFTVSGKGGGFRTHPGSNGYFLGGSVKGYPAPNFSISGAIDYNHLNNSGGAKETDYSLRGEFLFQPSVSISGTYVRSDFSPGSFHADSFGIGVTFRFDGPAGNLVDRDRNGPTGWSTTFAPLVLRF